LPDSRRHEIIAIDFLNSGDFLAIFNFNYVFYRIIGHTDIFFID